jgi:hypothetical protein
MLCKDAVCSICILYGYNDPSCAVATLDIIKMNYRETIVCIFEVLSRNGVPVYLYDKQHEGGQWEVMDEQPEELVQSMIDNDEMYYFFKSQVTDKLMNDLGNMIHVLTFERDFYETYFITWKDCPLRA